MADQGFNPNSPFAQAIKQYGMDKPEVSEDQYDAFRTRYFNSRIAPRLTPAQREKQRETFLQRTQRPKMPTTEYLSALGNVALGEFESVVGKPIASVAGKRWPKFQEEQKQLEAQVEKKRQALAFHGRGGGGVAQFAGGVGAYAFETAAVGRVAGPLVGAIPGAEPLLAPISRAAPWLKAAGRSLAFGAITAAEAEPGKRTSGFTTGTGWGVGGEVLGATLGGLWKYFKGEGKAVPTPKQADEQIKELARGEAPTTQMGKDIDAAFAEDITTAAKEPGYLKDLKVQVDEKFPNPQVSFMDDKNNVMTSTLSTRNLEKSYAQVREAIKAGRKLASITHDEFDTPFVNDLLAKLKQDFEPWSTIPTQVATNAASKGVDIGGGTARVDQRVLKYNYAKQAPSREEARRFIKGQLGESIKDSKMNELMADFDTAWNGIANWMARSEAASKLEGLGLTDLIPVPEVRARWKPSEGMNLPKIFNEKGWYERLDRWKGRTKDGEEVRLTLRDKEHATNAMKTLWNPTIPPSSQMFRSALQAITRLEMGPVFLPGQLNKEEIASLLNETRFGTETYEKAVGLVTRARQAPEQGMKGEHLYQQISRLAETFAKTKDVDEQRLVQQYGQKTVDAAKNMAALMWEKGKGDILKVQWDEDILKAGIREGILPPVDPSGKPMEAWFTEGEEHIAQQHGVAPDEITSLRRASLESRVLRLAEQYNVDPKNIDKELLEEVGEAEVARAKEIADTARKNGVSVYDSSLRDEYIRLHGMGEEEVFQPKGVPPSELPSRTPGEPSGLPTRTTRFEDGSTGRFAYKLTRAASGLPSRIYVMFDDAIAKRSSFTGRHSADARDLVEQFGKDPLFASVARDLKALADLNGISLERTPISLVHRPSKGFDLKHSASLIWHEDLHGVLSQIGLAHSVGEGRALRATEGPVNKLLSNAFKELPLSAQRTWNEVVNEVGKNFTDIYRARVLPEEAFVHAATAIRHGDTATLAQFAAADTDVEHIYEMVQSIAGELRRVAGEMAPGNSKNFIMDRLGLMEKFSNADRYKAVRETAEQMFKEVGGDIDVLTDRIAQQQYDRFERVLSAAEESIDGHLYAPNYTAMAELAGARHALYPTQFPPGRTPPPMPETGIEDGWNFASSAVWGHTIAPTFSFINSVDKKLNAMFSKKGAYLPLADSAKAIDETYRAGEEWLNANKKSAAEFLEGGKKKLETYGFMMTRPLSEWSALVQKMQLNNDDLARLKLSYNWLRKFQDDTGIPVFNYLVDEYPKLARRNFDPEAVYGKVSPKGGMATFHRLVLSGELNPRDLHLGRFINVVLREGMEKKFTGEALAKFRKVIDVKDKETGKYILGDLRPVLQRYHDYVRGIPDNGGKLVNNLVKEVQGGIDKTIARVNRNLPEGFKIPQVHWTGDWLRKGILLSYVSNLGLRPAIAVRDGLQGVTLSMPIMGPKAFAKGMALAVTKEHWLLAEKAGVLLKGKNVGDVFGDIFQELPPGKGGMVDKAIEAAGMLLAPSRWGHNFARRTVFAGSYDAALPAVKALRKLGAVDQAAAKDFFEKTGLWFADEARQKQLLSLARDKYVDPKEVAKQIGLEMLDLTLWPYRRGTQPGFLKTGVGRIFGQYGLWPMSFIDYMKRLGSKLTENPKKALPALGMFVAVNYELVHQGRKHFGVDMSRWFGLSPASFGGSPHLELVQNLLKAAHETSEGREARRKVLDYPLEFVPAWNEFQSLQDAWDKPLLDEEGFPTQDAWKALGFRPYKPGEPDLDRVLEGDLTTEKWLEFETQYKKTQAYKAYKKATE